MTSSRLHLRPIPPTQTAMQSLAFADRAPVPAMPSLAYDRVIETITSFEVNASLITRLAACPTCGGQLEAKGRSSMTVWDTPAAGKHVRIQLHSRRYACKQCGTFTDRGPDIHPKQGITWRLRHYIQRMSLKRSIKDMERITGATDEQIWPIVSELAERLSKHRFTTPRIVAVDDIRFGKKRRFTVIYNGENGHPLGIVEKLDAKGVGEKLHEIINPDEVEVFVSDMNGSNLLLGASSFKGKPHVADKWHVLDKIQRQMSRTINQTVNTLKKGPAAELKSWKAELEGKFAAVDAKIWRAMRDGQAIAPRRRETGDQQSLNLTTKWDVLRHHPSVRQVYHARLLLRHVYRASSRRQAEERFNRFVSFGQTAGIPPETAHAIQLLGEHRKQILAYFDVMWQHHDGRFRGPTTNQAESRNAKIKEMWKLSRGVRSAEYLNLRVVFEPYVLGATLVICEQCGQSETLTEMEGLQRAGMDIRDPRASRCSTCATSGTETHPKNTTIHHSGSDHLNSPDHSPSTKSPSAFLAGEKRPRWITN